MRKLMVELFVLGSLMVATTVLGSEPGWEGQVLKFGAEREKVQQTDILERPYRPLHFYGNTIRRRYYRGSAVPTMRDVSRGGAALFVRR